VIRINILHVLQTAIQEYNWPQMDFLWKDIYRIDVIISSLDFKNQVKLLFLLSYECQYLCCQLKVALKTKEG
jgi:hypothetical protein